MSDQPPLLEVRDLVQEFTVRDSSGVYKRVVHAVSGVSFELKAGETLGIVGETGSGKSTLARAIMQAPRPKSGEVLFRGTDLVKLRGRALAAERRQLQMVFQDPFGSLDPTWRVQQIVEEPLVAFSVGDRAARRRRVGEVLELAGLDPQRHARRRPLDPALIICDEAVSSLDMLIRAQVLNLFERLRSELSLSYLFIAHDLSLVKHVSDRVAVMYLGKLCEIGPATALYREPQHPYTLALLASIPSPDPRAAPSELDATVHGEPASPIDPPSGCRFRTRCPRAQERCALEEPKLRKLGDEHYAACHFPVSVPALATAGAQAQ
jgi:oligopeptide transport system ATP-binding protein